MNGHQYEYDCANRLRKSGFYKVSVTRGSGDQGIDVIAYKSGEKYGIQCKYYSSPVGNFAVQEAFAGAKHYNCKYAVVLTNNTFTKSARELAKSTNVLLWENDKIPSSIGQSQIIRLIGIFVCAVSVFGLIMMKSIENVPHPKLQKTYMIFLILGGIFNITEYGNYGADFLACIFYFLAIILHLFFGGFDKVVSAIFLICLIRMTFLYMKVNKPYKKIIKNSNKKETERYGEKAMSIKNNDLYKKVGLYAIRNNTYSTKEIASAIGGNFKEVNDCISAMIENGVITTSTYEKLGRFAIVMTEKEFLESIND